MKILVLSNMYPTAAAPSYGIFVQNFVKDIEHEGGETDLSVIQGKQSNIFLKLIAYSKFIIISCFKILKRDYDVIYVHYMAHSIIPVILLRQCIKKPIIYNGHGEDVKLNKSAEKIIEWVGRRTIKNSNLIVIPSSYFQEIVTERYPNISTFVSPSGGYNSEIFYPKISEEIKENELHIGYISRIDKGKGWDTLLESLNILKNESIKFKATFIGLGSEVEKLKEKISNLNLSNEVVFLGAMDQKLLGDQFRSFDVFVFPTKLDESLGLVGIESMACGIPVIGSNVASIKSYLINNENGFLFEPGNSIDLATKILMYKNLPLDLKKIMRQSCIIKSQVFSNDLVSANLFSKIKSICEQKSN